MGKRKQKKSKDPKPAAVPVPEPKRTDFWQEIGLGALVLVVAAFIVYFPALECGFIWDDPEYVINNQHLRTFGGLLKIWFGLSLGDEGLSLKSETPQFYPLVFTTFWLEYQLAGLKPTLYHFNNIALHILSAILLWRLLRRLAVPGAWLAAAIFLLHPVHVESVVWITERKNVLSLFFYLCAFHAYLRFDPPEATETDPTRASPESRRKFYILALVFFVFALLSKTVTCSLPAVIFLVLWWKRDSFGWAQIRSLLPLFAIGLLFGLMTAILEESHVGAKGDEWSLGFGERCLLAGRIPWFYAWKLVWPQELIFFYPRWEIDGGVWWQYLFPVALVGVIGTLWFMRGRIGKGPLVGVLVFVGTLVPALGFFNVYPMRFSFVADHFQYIASLGVIVLIAASATIGFAKLRKNGKPILWGFSALALILLGWQSQRQIPIYTNQVTLWQDTLQKNPDSWIAYNNLGEILFAEAQVSGSGSVQNRAKLDQAMQCTLEALKRKSDLPEAHGNLANAYFGLGEYDKAVEHYKRVLSLNPSPASFVTANHNLSITYGRLGKYEEAEACCKAIIADGSNTVKTHELLAGYLQNQGKYTEAINNLLVVVSQLPNDFLTHNKIGTLYQALGRNEEAAHHLKIALQYARPAGRTDIVTDIERRLQNMN